MSQPTPTRRRTRYAKDFPKVNTFTVDAVFGGRAQARKDPFDDGASWDQVLAAAER